MEKKLNISESYMSALVEISSEINSIQAEKPLLERILEIAVQQLSAERGFILLRNEKGELQPKVVKNIDPNEISKVGEISTTALDAVIEKRQPILTFDALSDSQFDDAKSVMIQKIRSIACVPLQLKGELIGAIYIDSRGKTAGFTRQSLSFLTAFANQAAIALENARYVEALQKENTILREEVHRIHAFDSLVGESKAMQQVFQVMSRVLDKDTTMLITGETGTGKEVIARAIHFNGKRQKQPFVAVNCAAIPENLIESELFGYKKGAFTGATMDKKGLIQTANTGTLFLDELGELPLHLQAKLLRFLQEKEVMPVGSSKPESVDVRIIAATNRDLAKEVSENRFREDLYYRLNILPILLPPLRERRKDIPLLGNFFLKKLSAKMNIDITNFSKDALEMLEQYHWPGNVRELENVIERAIILAQPPQISAEDIILPELQRKETIQAGMTLEEVSKVLLKKTLEANDGNKTRTAAALGVSLRWIHYKTKEWQLEEFLNDK